MTLPRGKLIESGGAAVTAEAWGGAATGSKPEKPGQAGYRGQLGAVALVQTVSSRMLVRTRFPSACRVSVQGPWELELPLCKVGGKKNKIGMQNADIEDIN
jgi:hypothetical protein